MSNVFVPLPYEERLHHLALGVEPLDGVLGGRATSCVEVLVEDHPSPLHDWRPFPRGTSLDDVLPRMDRHRSGRFLRLYDRVTPTSIGIRLVDPTRRYVPRRFVVSVAPESVVVDAALDDDVADVPVTRRSLRPSLLPGAAAALPAGATVLRGRVRRGDDPVRWVRVRAQLDGDDVGWAHGDDRGEFLLVVTNPDGAVGFLDPDIEVELTVGEIDPAPVPDPADPLTAEVDLLWDLLPEEVSPPVAASVADGRRFPPGFTTTTVPPVDVTVGRTRSIDIAL